MKNYITLIVTSVLVLLLIAISLYRKNVHEEDSNNKIAIDSNLDFDYKIIKSAHNNSNNKNYMISPLSIAYALSILEEGATDNTKDEIDKVLNNYSLPNVVNIKDKISLANALFIKNEFPIKEEFINKVKEQYNSEVLYDEFNTPDVINNWVNEKTYKMIPKAVDSLNTLFKLGIVNALAIDVEWRVQFECTDTKKETFTLSNKSKMNTAMMHTSKNISYFKIKGAKGIVKDYAKYNPTTGNKDYDEGTQLEYIAILPDNINDFMQNLNSETLNEIKNNLKESSEELEINLSLPKYTFDYTYGSFMKDLNALGIKDAFSEENAKFKNISDIDLYVNDAIHKSHIELSENGTKAAAVTVFSMATAGLPMKKPDIINIKFDKPFIFIIKDKNTNNIWFFGTVYEPMKYEDHKCETKDEEW